MSAETEHLALLRTSLAEMEGEAGRDPVLDRAVKVLLKVAIAHHERATASPVEAVIEHPPSYMESGEDLHPSIPAALGRTEI